MNSAGAMLPLPDFAVQLANRARAIRVFRVAGVLFGSVARLEHRCRPGCCHRPNQQRMWPLRMLIRSFLYVTGRTSRVGETADDIEVELLGVQRISLTTGEIDAESLSGVEVVSLWVDFGRNALYAYTYDEPRETSTDGAVETRPRRLDPPALEVTADREPSANEWIAAIPINET